MERKYYLRELAEKTGLAPSSVHKIMKKLAERRIVLTGSQKNKVLFELNYSSPVAAKCVSIIFINKIMCCKAFAKLIKLDPKGIYLFGTAASGKITGDSDIDLAILLESKQDMLKLSGIKRELSNELKKEIQLIILTGQKVRSMEKENIELLSQIKNKSIILWGDGIE
ncbi:MAG: nucleotidyltransferase domain-containing protein [Candidatus Diapherotrites archaeon]|nr:nucleotidyltransferase domain-containing protein [Candidatus Diapherotrites archaeon]